jgi:hypothetical protein
MQISRIKCGRPHLMRNVVSAHMWCCCQTAFAIKELRADEDHISSSYNERRNCIKSGLATHRFFGSRWFVTSHLASACAFPSRSISA